MANSLSSTTILDPASTKPKTTNANASESVTNAAGKPTTQAAALSASNGMSGQQTAQASVPALGRVGSTGVGNALSVNGYNAAGALGVEGADTATAAEETPAEAIMSNVTSETADKTREYLDAYNRDREQKIRDMYAGNLASQNARQQTALDANLANIRNAYQQNVESMRNAYEQNMSDADAARAQISPRYQAGMNALSAEYERQRRNNNMQGALNGINTGAGSQLALGQSVAYQGNQANLSRSEQEALNEADRAIGNLSRDYNNRNSALEMQYNNSMADLKTNYENKIAEAAANNDYQLAAALLDEYGAQYDRMMQQASQLAEFGDFSMYANIYGVDAAQQMEKIWAAQNPELAAAIGIPGAFGGTIDEYGITHLPNGNIVYAGREYGRAGKTAEQLSDYDLNFDLVYQAAKNRAENGGNNNLRYAYNRAHRGYYAGGGYSASRDRAYRGAPGYLNTDGQFYVPGYSSSSMNSEPYNQGEADALADRYGWTKG